MTLEEKLELFSQGQMNLKNSHQLFQFYLPIDVLEDPDNEDSFAELVLQLNWNSIIRSKLATIDELDKNTRFLLQHFCSLILDILDDARYTKQVELDLATL